MKNKKIALIITLAIIICTSIILIIYPKDSAKELFAVVECDGEVILVEKLGKPSAPQKFNLLERAKKDVIVEIGEDYARVIHSDCPDKVCIKSGFLRENGEAAVCLPNRIILYITDNPPK